MADNETHDYKFHAIKKGNTVFSTNFVQTLIDELEQRINVKIEDIRAKFNIFGHQHYTKDIELTPNFKYDENGNLVYDSSGNPVILSEDKIGFDGSIITSGEISVPISSNANVKIKTTKAKVDAPGIVYPVDAQTNNIAYNGLDKGDTDEAGIFIKDKNTSTGGSDNSSTLGEFKTYLDSSGLVKTGFVNHNKKVNGDAVDSHFYMTAAKDGTVSYDISHAEELTKYLRIPEFRSGHAYFDLISQPEDAPGRRYEVYSYPAWDPPFDKKPNIFLTIEVLPWDEQSDDFKNKGRDTYDDGNAPVGHFAFTRIAVFADDVRPDGFTIRVRRSSTQEDVVRFYVHWVAILDKNRVDQWNVS